MLHRVLIFLALQFLVVVHAADWSDGGLGYIRPLKRTIREPMSHLFARQASTDCGTDSCPVCCNTGTADAGCCPAGSSCLPQNECSVACTSADTQCSFGGCCPPGQACDATTQACILDNSGSGSGSGVGVATTAPGEGATPTVGGDLETATSVAGAQGGNTSVTSPENTSPAAVGTVSPTSPEGGDNLASGSSTPSSTLGSQLQPTNGVAGTPKLGGPSTSTHSAAMSISAMSGVWVRIALGLVASIIGGAVIISG